jgi:hypothetical protein
MGVVMTAIVVVVPALLAKMVVVLDEMRYEMRKMYRLAARTLMRIEDKHS